MADPFRPTRNPAQAIYDAFQAEAAKRAEVPTINEWLSNERQAVWSAARDQAQQLGLRVPTLAEVMRAEQSACGHIDYGKKWAYGVVEFMREEASEQ